MDNNINIVSDLCGNFGHDSYPDWHPFLKAVSIMANKTKPEITLKR